MKQHYDWLEIQYILSNFYISTVLDLCIDLGWLPEEELGDCRARWGDAEIEISGVMISGVKGCSRSCAILLAFSFDTSKDFDLYKVLTRDVLWDLDLDVDLVCASWRGVTFCNPGATGTVVVSTSLNGGGAAFSIVAGRSGPEASKLEDESGDLPTLWNLGISGSEDRLSRNTRTKCFALT